MTISADKIAELRLKHLELLQTLITRMAGYGVSFKSYCITVATTVIGFGFTLHRPLVSALAILPILTFAFADAQYSSRRTPLSWSLQSRAHRKLGTDAKL